MRDKVSIFLTHIVSCMSEKDISCYIKVSFEKPRLIVCFCFPFYFSGGRSVCEGKDSVNFFLFKRF